MKFTPLVSALVIASLTASSLTFAQGYDRRDPREGPPQVQQHGPRHMDPREQNRYEQRADHRMGHRHDRRFDRERDDRFYPPEARRNDRYEYYNARGPEFRRGGHIPREFRNRQYVINDYRMYHLSPPPRGHQWVQVGADYVLVAIATGLIVSILLNN
jgi:Ni/Co efflux regulator RcnB